MFTRLPLVLRIGMVHAAVFSCSVGLSAALPEIEHLKPLYPETVYVRDQVPAAVILWGDPSLEPLAHQLAESLEQRTGSRLPVLSANQLISEWWEIDFDQLAGRNVISLGNINTNRLNAVLWGEGYTLADSVFPGDNGYVVRTVHDPFARGFNVTVLAGAHPAEVSQAVDAFLERHLKHDGNTWQTPTPTVEVKPGNPPPLYVSNDGHPSGPAELPHFPSAREFAQQLDAMMGAERSRTDDPSKRGDRTLVNLTAVLSRLADAWFHTGDAGLPPLMKRVLDENRALLEIVPERVEMEGASADHLRAWDLIEELPVWTDADRLALSNAFLRDARQGFEQRAANQLVKEGYVQVIDENHGTRSALNTLNAWGYFDKYYDLPDTAYWMGVVRATFAGQLASHQILEDSATYAMHTPAHNVEYALRTRDMRYFQLGLARTQFDFLLQAAQTQAGNTTGFGDSTPLRLRDYKAFARLAWFTQDPEIWWWLRDQLPNACGIQPYEPGMPWDVDAPIAPPTDWDGITVFPIYRQNLGREPASKTFVSTPADPVGPEWFNKIVFREGLSPDQQFLLLDGAGVWKAVGAGEFPPGPAGHNHRDINTLPTFADLGRLWLIDHTYSARGITDHSGLIITRDGLMDYPVHPARALNVAVSDAFGLTRTVYPGFSGATWERSIFWKRGDYFVVLDRAIATEEGDFSVRSQFRALGEHQLDGPNLWLEQQGRHGLIATDGAARLRVEEDAYQETRQWTDYTFAEPVAKIFQGFQFGSLAAGEALAFATLLVADENVDTLRRARIQRLNTETVRVENGASPALFGVGVPPGFEGQLDAYAITADSLLLVGVTRLGPLEAPVFTSTIPVNLVHEDSKLRVVSDLRPSASPSGTAETRIDEKLAAYLQGAIRAALASDAHVSSAPSTASKRPRIPVLEPLAVSRLASSAHMLVLQDLDNDGVAERLLATDTGLIVQRASGETLWQFDTPAPCRALAVADLDNDGEPEIALGCDDTNVYLLDARGHERWRFACKSSDRTFPPAVDQLYITDLDGDNQPEIIAIGNWVHCLAPDGTLRWEDYQKFERSRYSGDAQAFVIDDIDGDGHLDVAVNFLYNYSVLIGYDAHGQRNFPTDPKRIKHGGMRIPRPQGLAVADLFADGGHRELIIATHDNLTIRRTDPATEGNALREEVGNFGALHVWTAPDQKPLVFAGTDLGAVFALQAEGDAIERRWVRSVGSEIKTMVTTVSSDGTPTLWVGTLAGAVNCLDPMTGQIRSATAATGSPVVQFVVEGQRLHTLHADGTLATIALP